MQFHIWFVDMTINIFYYLEYYNKCPKIIWRHAFVLLATALYSHTFKRGITLLQFTQLFQFLTGYLKLLWAIYFILWRVYKYLLLDSYNHTKSSFIRTCLVFYALNTCMYYMSDFSVLRRYIWLLFRMWVVHIMLNIFYSLKFDVHCASKKIMGVISEILVNVTNRYIFQRAVTLLFMTRLLPNLVYRLEILSTSIFVLYHI